MKLKLKLELLYIDNISNKLAKNIIKKAIHQYIFEKLNYNEYY